MDMGIEAIAEGISKVRSSSCEFIFMVYYSSDKESPLTKVHLHSVYRRLVMCGLAWNSWRWWAVSAVPHLLQSGETFEREKSGFTDRSPVSPCTTTSGCSPNASTTVDTSRSKSAGHGPGAPPKVSLPRYDGAGGLSVNTSAALTVHLFHLHVAGVHLHHPESILRCRLTSCESSRGFVADERSSKSYSLRFIHLYLYVSSFPKGNICVHGLHILPCILF